MGVKIAEKLEQFNNGTYMLMDASAVEYQTQDGNSISVQEALDNGAGGAGDGEIIDDENVVTDKTYSSFKIEEELEGLETELYDYMNTALAGLNKLTKEIIDDVALVVNDNVLYLYKDPDDTGNTYMQMMLINGIAVELGSTEVNLDEYVTEIELQESISSIDLSNYYNKTEIDEKLANFAGDGEADNSKATLITNTTTLKLDVTKMNSSYHGAIKLTYLYDTSPVEVEISFRSATDDLRWAVINGQKYINKITYTQDSTNTAHYTIGIEFSGTTYGCYQAEVIGGFANINELTKEAFTGDKTAIYYSPWGKNNGVTLVSTPEDVGLTFPCTTVQLTQAMKDKFNKIIRAGAIGVFNCESKTKTITDAPADYGLLHIETFANDRILIRFDGISYSTYAGSWIGQIKGNSGTFTDITWSRLDNESRISELEADVNELFQSVSSGKTLVANAITGKGVSTATDATFATMASNISKITNYTASEKQALANAITSKGVSTSSTDSFSTMATNISKIPQTTQWKEETVSATADSTTRIAKFKFSNTVLGVRQLTPSGYHYVAEVKGTKMFTITSNCVEVYLPDGGTWQMTAVVWNSTMT